MTNAAKYFFMFNIINVQAFSIVTFPVIAEKHVLSAITKQPRSHEEYRTTKNFYKKYVYTLCIIGVVELTIK